MNHDPSKLVLVPEGISEMELTLTYSPLSAELRGIVSLYATIDKDGDGAPDWTQSGSPLSSARTDVLEVSESDWGSIWSVNVEGRGIDWKLGDRIRDTQYREVRCEFTVSLNATFSPGTHMLPISDEHAKMAKWKPLDTGSSSSELRYERNIYDLGEVATIGGPEHPESGSSPFIWLMVLLAAAIVCATAFYLIRRRKAHKA